MALESEDKYKKDSHLENLRDVLLELHQIAPKSFSDPEAIMKWDLVDFFEKNRLLQPEFKENFQRWPEPIQNYFKKELVAYVSFNKEFTQKDLEIINDNFLETAFFNLPECPVGQFPDEQLERALKAVSKELRRYYGLEENETEFPCWSRG